MKVYVASKTRHAGKWRKLRNSGLPIACTWIDEANAGETRSRTELARRCIKEVETSDCVILFCGSKETQSGALVECGAALAWGKPVIVVSKRAKPPSIFATLNEWHTTTSLREAFKLALELTHKA